MGRRSDHTRDELREMSLRAARAIIRGKGVQALSARAVAKRIGYTPGTLYQLFDSFDHLILAVNVGTVAEIRQRMDRETKDLTDAVEKLKVVARVYTEYAMAHPGLWRLAFEHTMPDPDKPPGALTDQTDAIFLWISELLSQATDTPRADVSAAALWAGVHGVCHLGVTGKLSLSGTDGATQVTERVVESVIAGMQS